MPKQKKKLRGIGFDPGKVNCAYALWDKAKLGDTDVIEGIEDVTHLYDFTVRVARILDWYKPDVMGIERYQLRQGRGFVGNMEMVNLMIGIIAGLCHERSIEVYLVLPSVHKTWASKHNGAQKKKGKLCMHTCPDFEHLDTEHEADAANVIKYVFKKLVET
jgi:Holliday junction resolvasome RuvABC endonuclease subunit